MPLQTQMLPEYLSQLPESLPDDGRVLVHNNIRPSSFIPSYRHRLGNVTKDSKVASWLSEKTRGVLIGFAIFRRA